MSAVKSSIKKIIKFLQNARQTAKRVNTNRWCQIGFLLDIIYCKLKFHVSDEEYLDYQFYNYRDCYRKNFFVRYHQRTEFKKINNGSKLTKFKYAFFLKMPESFSREIILSSLSGEEGFVEFAKKHGRIVVKPNAGSLGRNINLFFYTDDEQARNYYASFSEDMVCEEYIYQHDTMSEMNPFSVNSLRMVSFLNQGEVIIVAATLRTGSQPGVIVDNMCSNGIGAQVELSTGIICTHGFDYHDHMYVTHPISGIQFLGFKIPNWNEAVERVKEAHKKLPQYGILGWDIAITQTGVDIIEANDAPGIPIMQMGDMKPRGGDVLRVTRGIKARKNGKNKV